MAGVVRIFHYFPQETGKRPNVASTGARKGLNHACPRDMIGWAVALERTTGAAVFQCYNATVKRILCGRNPCLGRAGGGLLLYVLRIADESGTRKACER